MKPPRFGYHDPDRLDDALDLLAYFQEDSKVLAGGQSLMPLLNLRLARPGHLIDINRIGALRGIEAADGIVRIGAMTRHADVEASDLVHDLTPLLSHAVPHIGHAAIRNRGTLGGSLAHADPSAELPAVMTALDATVTLATRVGERRVPASEFFVMPLTTVAAADELLIAIEIPAQSPDAGTAVEELARRRGDFAIVGVAAVVELDDSAQVSSTRIVTFGTGPRPVRHTGCEQLVTGRQVSDAVLDELRRIAAAEVAPSGDRHGSTAYRKTVTGVMVERTVRRAHERALQKREGGDTS
jgi:aerobic carbon-monoxide dehydrogenase medium subunit